MKLLIFLLILIIGLVSNVNCQFDTNQVNSLNTIATNCGFTWNSPMKCGVTSTTNLNILVNCDSNDNINEIRFQSQSKTCGLADDFYNYFPNLKKLIVTDLDVQTLSKTIYQHTNIETFTSITSTGSFVITSENNSWQQMTSLKYLNLNNVLGTVPTFPTSLIEFTISAKGIDNIVSRFPIEVFTPSLKLFSISFYKVPDVAPKITIKDYDIFTKSPNLQTLFFYYLGYPAEFKVFYNPPSTLSTMQIYGLSLDNTTMPSINEISWNNLNILVLNSLKLTGTLSNEIYYLNKLTIFYANQNPSLTGKIPNDFSQKSKLSQLYLQGTAIDGSLPNDMFDTQLKILDISGTSIGGVAPDIFLCLPTNVFSDSGDVNYKIKFDNNKFSNFPSILTRSACIPKITSITTPIDSTTYSLQIEGSMLGSFTPFTLVTMKNQIYQTDLYCQSSIPGRLISCNNPGIFGNGTLTVYAKNQATPIPSGTFSFKYSEPIISSVTSLKTLGGKITVFGVNLWISSTQANYFTDYNYIKLIKNDGSSVDCSDISIISAYSTLTCNLPAGIEGGSLVVSVSGQKNIDTYAFNYQGPIISGFSTPHNNLIPTNKEISITIKGSNFWNDSNLVQVQLDTTDCLVTNVIDSEIVCTLPAMAYKSPEGSLDLSVFINGQGSNKKEYVQMVDPNICPNNCGSSKCDPVIGMCMCSEDTFGPACSLNTTQSKSNIGMVNNRPTLIITPSQASNETSFSVSLISIVEGSTEITLDKWSSNQLDDYTTEYIYTGDKGQIVTVFIRRNLETNKDDFISYPSNSYTYGVKYQNKDKVDLPQFKFQLEPYPYECAGFPFNLAYPSYSNSDLRFLSLNTYNVQYSGRFPIKAYYNDINTIRTITTNVFSNTGNYSRIVTQLNQYSVEFTQFEFDFTTFSNTIPREPSITGCILPTRPQITQSSNSKGMKIGVGIGVSIGGCLLGAAIALIIRQRMKLNKTQSLLNKKLQEINNGL